METWIPFLQSLIWPFFIGLLLLLFRGWFRELLDAIKKRVESGSAMSVGPGGFALGPAPKLEEPKEEDKSPKQAVERFAEETKKVPPQKETTLELSKYFRLVHSATYNPDWSQRKGRPYYTIRVWLDGPPEIIQKVSKVIYHLHPSFPNPDRETSNPEKNFELLTYGWGQFNMSADLYFEDGTKALKLFRYINF